MEAETRDGRWGKSRFSTLAEAVLMLAAVSMVVAGVFRLPVAGWVRQHLHRPFLEYLAMPSFAWGLAFGYLRERTGSLLPPALVHGIPQAIAWAFLGR